ncbi:hypothetical protein CLORY_38460 [Clostridium oryzae]|uniref:Uncharacterized protein n=1 Tax=Clostridium oryzae TaxID=1450648 RepID=A0A1V4IEH2_9CLOT|nr:hypothetical protein CLORY_38460 [Clostridium oryzae]
MKQVDKTMIIGDILKLDAGIAVDPLINKINSYLAEIN